MIDSLISAFRELYSNPMFAGLFSAGLLGGIIVSLKRSPSYVFSWLKYHFTTTLIIRNTSPAYNDVIVWLSNLDVGKNSRKLSIVLDDDCDGYKVSLGYGTFFFMHQGRFFVVERSFDKETKITSRDIPEMLTITAVTRDNTLLANVIKKASHRPVDGINIYSWTGWWRKIDMRPVRPMDTVILPIGQRERIISDIAWYMDSADWYRDRSIPWRRGYLFYGPPGTGKTSLAFAIASHFRKPLYLLSLSAINDDAALFDAITSIPSGAIILMEDVDAVKTTAVRSDESSESDGVTLSGLLNTIDGVAAPEGRLLIMTTNHRDRLDPALIRPGRADVHELIGPLDDEEIQSMGHKFYGNEYVTDLKGPLPAAEVQRYLISNKQG